MFEGLLPRDILGEKLENNISMNALREFTMPVSTSCTSKCLEQISILQETLDIYSLMTKIHRIKYNCYKKSLITSMFEEPFL